MSKQTERIARKLHAAGAAYSPSDHKHVAPGDPGEMAGDAKPTYHVLPNVEQPYQSSILRFPNLATLESWLDMRIAAADMDDEAAERYVAAWYAAHDL